jgi:hypothetical protein
MSKTEVKEGRNWGKNILNHVKRRKEKRHRKEQRY